MASEEVQVASIVPAANGAIGVAASGAVAVAVVWGLAGPASIGWLAALAYLAVSTALLLGAMRRRGTRRLGWANLVTATRSAMVAIIAGLVVASFAGPIPVPLLIGLVVPALLLDAVDGWVARRTGGISELGARFDMEVDAFLLLVLSVYVAPLLGSWVLAIGLMRYAFVVAGWMLPWMRVELPPRFWRKVVTAVQGIALTVAASGLVPTLAAVLVAVALALLVESFGRDVVWLAMRNRARSRARSRARARDRARGAEAEAS
jgi:phosphatidylglycerophosphate synthase